MSLITQEDKKKAAAVYMRITGYSARQELGGIDRAWIEEKIAQAIAEARTHALVKPIEDLALKIWEMFPTKDEPKREFPNIDTTEDVSMPGTPRKLPSDVTEWLKEKVKKRGEGLIEDNVVLAGKVGYREGAMDMYFRRQEEVDFLKVTLKTVNAQFDQCSKLGMELHRERDELRKALQAFVEDVAKNFEFPKYARAMFMAEKILRK